MEIQSPSTPTGSCARVHGGGLAMDFDEWDKSTGFEGNAADSWVAATLAERERCVKICTCIIDDWRTDYDVARTADRILEKIKGET